jgi:hypothetical protein
MEIEEFIEQDILIFLDERLDKPRAGVATRTKTTITSPYISRDYERDFFDAMDRKDLMAAKNVLHDLKAKFDECPNGVPEKMQLKSLLLDLYEKFKDYLDAQNTFSKIDERLSGNPTMTPVAETAAPLPPVMNAPTPPSTSPASIIAAPIVSQDPVIPVEAPIPLAIPLPVPTIAPVVVIPLQATPPAPTTAPPATPVAIAIPITPPLPEIPPVPSIDQVIDEKCDDIDELLRRDEVKTAAQRYHEMKRAIMNSEARISDTTAKRVLNTYRTIRTNLPLPDLSLAQVRPTRIITPTPKESGKPDALPSLPAIESIDPDKQILFQLEEKKRALDTLLQDDKLAEAALMYRTMRLLAQQIRSPDRASSVSKKLQHIYDLIKELQTHASGKDRLLSGALP